MKTNQEILDEFGKLLINDVLDRYYKNIDYIVENGYKNPTMLHYNELFLKLKPRFLKNFEGVLSSKLIVSPFFSTSKYLGLIR